MAVPVHTTTVRVERVPADANRDPYDPEPPAATVAAGVRAHISTSTGTEDQEAGTRSVMSFRMSCDPFDGGLRHTDTVIDEQSGEVYEVTWAVSRKGFGLDHFQAGLRQISGIV